MRAGEDLQDLLGNSRMEGLKPIDGVEISTMNQLKGWVVESDRVLTF
jgi:sulfur relay (sulfurtransferase) complex TusBCD TusD component (DsrE family)